LAQRVVYLYNLYNVSSGRLLKKSYILVKKTALHYWPLEICRCIIDKKSMYTNQKIS